MTTPDKCIDDIRMAISELLGDRESIEMEEPLPSINNRMHYQMILSLWTSDEQLGYTEGLGFELYRPNPDRVWFHGTKEFYRYPEERDELLQDINDYISRRRKRLDRTWKRY